MFASGLSRAVGRRAGPAVRARARVIAAARRRRPAARARAPTAGCAG